MSEKLEWNQGEDSRNYSSGKFLELKIFYYIDYITVYLSITIAISMINLLPLAIINCLVKSVAIQQIHCYIVAKLHSLCAFIFVCASRKQSCF